MIRPASFGLQRDSSKQRFQNLPRAEKLPLIKEKAIAEFDRFIETLKKKILRCWLFRITQSAQPDAAFPNNWFCTLSDLHNCRFSNVPQTGGKNNDLLQMLIEKYEVRDGED